MQEEIFLSTAYFPPSVCFSLTSAAEKVVVERWENYHKQTYRNRCVILGANGPISLVVPVIRGSFHKTAIRDLLVDDMLKWRTIHVRSIISAYAMAPYFEYYIDIIENAINKKCRYLIDYNHNITEQINNCIGLSVPFVFSEEFTPVTGRTNDYRYSISPKIKTPVEGYSEKPYLQVFSDKFGFTPGLSIIDTLLNNGPGTLAILRESLVY
ncbi:MAG TPA: WbqC family protein [Bacteroidales bacterium]|nr:WbqC family protein [Bacteroidales bacterium]